MSEITISVVIPVYNASRTLSRAIDSVLSQTHAALEIIVVDDGSTDDLASLREAYREFDVDQNHDKLSDRCLIRWIHQVNQGVSAARNTGIRSSLGTHIAFLDSDDFWEHNKLEIQSQVFRDYPSVGICGSNFYTCLPNQERVLLARHIHRSPVHNQVTQASGRDIFDVGCCFSTVSTVIARSAIDEPFFDRTLPLAEDRDLWIRTISKVPYYYLDNPTATVVMEPGSISRSNLDRDCNCMLQVVERYRHLLGPTGVRWWQARIYRRWANEYLESNDKRQAIGPAWQFLKRSPRSPKAWLILLKAVLSFCS